MTNLQLKTEFTARADDQVDDSQIQTWINLGYDRLQADFERLPALRGTDTSKTTVAGTASYTFDATDIDKPLKLWVGTTEYSRLDLQDSLDTSVSNVYTFSITYTSTGSSMTITLLPAAVNTGDQITLYYEKTLADLSADSDVPQFSPKYHEILLYAAWQRYHEREKEMSKAAYYETQYVNKLAALVQYYFRLSAGDDVRTRSQAELLGLDY